MRKIFLAVFTLIALGTFATAQEQKPSFMDTLKQLVNQGNDAVANMAPVITSCNYGNTTQPVEQLCAILEGGGLVSGVGKPDTAIGVLIATLAELADIGRKPDQAQEAEDLLTNWYDQLGIPTKRCSNSPGKTVSGEAHFSFVCDGGAQVAAIYKQRLRQCTDGTLAACTIPREEWNLIGTSLELVQPSYPDNAEDWTRLDNALNAYSAREN